MLSLHSSLNSSETNVTYAWLMTCRTLLGKVYATIYFMNMNLTGLEDGNNFNILLYCNNSYLYTCFITSFIIRDKQAV